MDVLTIKTLKMKRIFSLMIVALISVPSFGQETRLLDTEVASVAVVANQIDIDYAQIALEKSENKEILDFVGGCRENQKKAQKNLQEKI